MCNLYKLRTTRGEVAALFAATDHWQAEPARDYVAPGKEGPVVVARDGVRTLGLMTWGIPHAGKAVTNVRNLQSPFWRPLLDRPTHRCLVPVTEFEEWSATPDPATGRKRAHWFAIPSRPIFAFAGVWRKIEGAPHFAILTTEPNSLVGAVHPKAMPVLLDEADYTRWLEAPWAAAQGLVSAYPSQLMIMD
ncbi:SOS response-associated peptidase [Novosphingobium sp.]|uniref:SOS response-associated peptidase n=1 Tax=Novosphingobium sp. TaxID=1874826 RepID=UPI002FDDFB96